MTNYQGCCGWGFYVGALAWLLISSGLLWMTWNRVIAALTKAKPAQYWQAFLLILTVCVLGIPKHMKQHHMGHCGHCGTERHCCGHCGTERHCCGHSKCHKDTDRDSDCPYSKGDHSEKSGDEGHGKHHD